MATIPVKAENGHNIYLPHSKLFPLISTTTGHKKVIIKYNIKESAPPHAKI